MRTGIGLVVVGTLVGCSPAEPGGAATQPAAAASPDVAAVAAAYRSMRAMTAGPVLVDPGFALLCRGVTPADVEAARRRSGPHAMAAVMIYMNDAAAGAFGRPNAVYPVGSVVVKEKTLAAGSARAATRPRSEDSGGVGGMIKRPAGFDPAHGDWEYFYFDDPSRLERGAIRSCVDCHAGAKDRDYVFGGWATAAR